MKHLNYRLLVSILIFSCNILFPQSYVYISPKDNSILVSLKTNIILRSNEDINPASLSPDEFSISGSISGAHQGKVKLSDDNKTILFMPDKQFAANENVNVNIYRGIRTTDGRYLPLDEIHFKTTPLEHRINSNPGIAQSVKNISAVPVFKSINKFLSTDSLPTDYPQVNVGTSNNPSPGNIFITNQGRGDTSIGYFLMILNNDGSTLEYKKLPKPANLFKMEPDGDLSYNITADGTRIILDTSLSPIDTFQCGNGYKANGHDFLLLPNGHAIMFANDREPVNMSKIVAGGDTNAIVTGVIVQELDASKNVVFQWRSWDYIPDTDSYYDLTAASIDLLHANGLAVDADGNILVSMRHLSSIVKINRQTGDVMWMLGGKQNNFTFINEHEYNAPTYFSYQHDIAVLPNGDITLFDNGNQHSPEYSRAVEYKLDENNMTATLVWEYRHNPDIFATSMGSVQRLPDGNTMVGWGQGSALINNPIFTEVTPEGSIALEFYLPKTEYSYRAYVYPWKSQQPEATAVNQQNLYEGNTYNFNNDSSSTGISVKFNSLTTTSLSPEAVVNRFSYAPMHPVFYSKAPIFEAEYFSIIGNGIASFSGTVKIDLNNYPLVTNPAETIIYARSSTGNNFVPLATSYDPQDDLLTFTTSSFGDFAFGIPKDIDSSYTPVQVLPKDSALVDEEVPVNLVWGKRGLVQSYHLQVSTDPSFNNLVVDDQSVNSTSYLFNSPPNNTVYYWRVNNTNALGTSNWSNVRRFITSPPYIKVLSPDGGERINLDSNYVIRWQSDITDTLNVELVEGNNIASVISDGVAYGTKAILWHVPSNLKPDTTYKIKVASKSNSSLSGTSISDFTISSGVTSIDALNSGINSFELFQNYPDPFNPSTVIEYSLPVESQVRIIIFNTLGQKVTTLVNSKQKSGNYKVSWNASGIASGIYFYSLKAENNSGKDFYTVKKMILLK